MGVMIYEIYVKSESSFILPRFSGTMARGMFYNLIQDLDKELSDRIHDGDVLKTISISQFSKVNRINSTLLVNTGTQEDKLKNVMNSMGISEDKKRINWRRDRKIEEGDLLRINICSANTELNNKLPQILGNRWFADKEKVYLSTVQVNPRNFDPQNIITDNNPIRIKFITPVAFSKGSMANVFPNPEDVFNNLASIWNSWYPDNIINKEILSEANNNIQVSSASGRVISVPTGKKQMHRGWIGNVSYYFKDQSHQSIANVLLNLGQYSGVGRGRTSGFGMFRFDKKYQKKSEDK